MARRTSGAKLMTRNAARSWRARGGWYCDSGISSCMRNATGCLRESMRPATLDAQPPHPHPLSPAKETAEKVSVTAREAFGFHGSRHNIDDAGRMSFMAEHVDGRGTGP